MPNANIELRLKFLMAEGRDCYKVVNEVRDLTAADLPTGCWGYQYAWHEVINHNGEVLTSVEPTFKSATTYVGIKAKVGDVFFDVGESHLQPALDASETGECVICTWPSRGTMIFPLNFGDEVIHPL